MALSTTTKLEAVNTLLGSIGESPVNSLNSGLVDAKTAENIIDAVSRERYNLRAGHLIQTTSVASSLTVITSFFSQVIS